MYVYETHCHTNIVSRCSRFDPKDIVEFYVKNGYAGVFITDHFLNGNCVDALRDTSISYKDRIKGLCEGYKTVKRLAGDRLQVFFGFEYSYDGTDILVYGWDEERLSNFPEIMDMDMRSFINFANQNGALTVHAHPFREARYIDHVRLYSEVKGIETFNAMRDERTNRLAEFYASEYNKIKFSGSDNHGIYIPEFIGGMAFTEKLKDEADFIEKVTADKAILCKNKTVMI